MFDKPKNIPNHFVTHTTTMGGEFSRDPLK